MTSPIEIEIRFPENFFPPMIERFRTSAARSIGIADEYLAGPMLAAASVGIGTTHRVVVKQGWEEPASLFTAIVGWPSTGKSPGISMALAPLADRQRQYDIGATIVTEEDLLDLDQDRREGGQGEAADNHSGGDNRSAGYQIGSLPPRPAHQRAPQLIVKDTTLPALWDCLADNPRGVMIAVDELASMFLQATPAQRQTYCDIYQCDSRTVHRKSGKRGPIIIPRTFATLCGGIQPDLFPSIRGTHDGGLIERFLICGQSERMLPPFVQDVLDPDAETAWHLAVVALLSIEWAEYHGPSDNRGRVPFTRAAVGRLTKLYKLLEDHLVSRNVHIKYQGIVRKLTANAARLALVRRCLRWASGEFGLFGPVGMIEEEDADAACRAAEFFLSRYLYWRPEVLNTAGGAAVTVTPQPPALADRILSYARSKGRTELDVRWLRQQTLEGNPSTKAIRAALDEAVNRGSGRWKDPGKKTFICE